ncbi:MAG: nitroreductase family protein, partial [Actinobacteria bacterium]|nr:nitroreductase family protein [Actinomycetota bacterium]
TRKLSRLWVEKGLPTDLPDYLWGQRLISFADTLQAGGRVDLSAYAPRRLTPEEADFFHRVLRERRSVRHWTEEDVPDWMIDRILESGLWAAHSCNLQSIRFIVVREKGMPGLFKGSDIPGGPVHLVILQDERVYRANELMPVRNRLLDCGAAAQNMVLTAHALGLGGVWLTFSDKMVERLAERFRLPEMIKIVTYVDVGFPAQSPAPPGRIGLVEAVLERV